MDLFIMLIFIRKEVRGMSKLIPLEFNNQRIMTTKTLAEQFGTEETNIKTNFNRNKERFIEGKHYYQLQGEELKGFKKLVTESNDQIISNKTTILTLWTDRGAARHAKILDTDEAWEVYEELEDTYFRIKEKTQLISAEKHVKELQNTVAEFKRLAEEAKQQYKPSHKMKLDYSKMIRALTNTDEEYEMVKEWVFGNLGYTKWEDACIDDNNKIIDTIKTVARLISIKKMEQISMFNKSNV